MSSTLRFEQHVTVTRLDSFGDLAGGETVGRGTGCANARTSGSVGALAGNRQGHPAPVHEEQLVKLPPADFTRSAQRHRRIHEEAVVKVGSETSAGFSRHPFGIILSECFAEKRQEMRFGDSHSTARPRETMRRSGCHQNPTLDLDMERCVDSSVRNRFSANVHKSGVSPFRFAVASAFAHPRSRGWRGERDGPLLLSPSGGHTTAATDSCQDR
jgi:hypothetical protein